RLAITGAAASLSGTARYVPATNELNAQLVAELPRLKPLGAAFGVDTTGTASAQLSAAGPLDRLQLSGSVKGSELTGAGAKLDQLQLAAEVTDLSHPKGSVDGSFRTQGLDGRLALAAELNENSDLLVPRFRLAAADSAVEGTFGVRLDTGLIRGSVAGRAGDLAPWSRLAGTPLGGRLDFTIGMDARGGQLVDFSLDGTSLTAG